MYLTAKEEFLFSVKITLITQSFCFSSMLNTWGD